MAVYVSTYLNPKNNCIDMASDQNFTCQVNGTMIDAYQLVIKKVSDNSTLYTSKTTLTPLTYLYDKDTLTHTIPAGFITYRGACKWTVITYSGALGATPTEVLFYNQTTPILTFSPPATITSKLYNFTATYSQAEGIALKRFKFIWYDSSNTIIEDSGWIYSSNVHYQFDGFLNGKTYKVKCIVENQLGVIIDSGFKSFLINYAQPSLTIIPDVTLLEDESAIKVDWSKAKQILGNFSGIGGGSFVDDFMVTGNTALSIGLFSYVYFDLTIPKDSTTTLVYQPDPSMESGIIVRLGIGTINYDIGYDGTRFYFNNNGICVYGTPKVLPTTPIYIAIRSQDVLIMEPVDYVCGFGCTYEYYNVNILDWLKSY